jgi:flagellar hook-basal body complex protein FliE
MTIQAVSGAAAIARPEVDAVSRVASSGGPAAVASGTDFSEMLGAAIADVAGQLRRAEAVSLAGIKGMASTQEVVEQIVMAEQSLQASIAIRDKIVAAYLEISRMQI